MIERRYLQMKIKQAAEKSGLTPRNIRFYEESGLIGVGREENGYREYNDQDIIRLKQIRVLRELGIGIEDIRSYFRKQVSLNELMKKRKEELRTQKEDVQSLLEICESIEKQDLPLIEYTTNTIESALHNRTNKSSIKQYGKILTSNVSNRLTRKSFIGGFVVSSIIIVFVTLLVCMNLYDLVFMKYSNILTQSQVNSLTFVTIILAIIACFVATIFDSKNQYFELREEGIYFMDPNANKSSWNCFKNIMRNEAIKNFDFIDYDDIIAVKAGVQEAGMITGGDYLFKFYLVVFTIDDRAIRLDSRLFTNGEHFLITLRILHEKAPKWIDPKHLAQLLEMPNEKAYKILNQYYWNKRPWHDTSLYKKLSRK